MEAHPASETLWAFSLRQSTMSKNWKPQTLRYFTQLHQAAQW